MRAIVSEIRFVIVLGCKWNGKLVLKLFCDCAGLCIENSESLLHSMLAKKLQISLRMPFCLFHFSPKQSRKTPTKYYPREGNS